MSDSPVLAIDPARQFGAVCVAGTRIPAATLAGMVLAGDPVDKVAEWYDLRRVDVLLCCWWAAQTGEIWPTRRRAKSAAAWRQWADEALPILGRHSDADPATCPDPPEAP